MQQLPLLRGDMGRRQGVDEIEGVGGFGALFEFGDKFGEFGFLIFEFGFAVFAAVG